MATGFLARDGNSAQPTMTPPERETIVALASGPPPAAIAVVRLSGAHAFVSASALVGELPRPRRASFRAVRQPGSRELIDRALVLCFSGPASATGEDVVEFHLHGGAAVISALLEAVVLLPGVRMADPGEFTRRAFLNGRIDLSQAEALGNLLAAEGEAQRVQAVRGMEGVLGRQITIWRGALIDLLSQLEGELDFPDEADAAESINVEAALSRLCDEMTCELTKASAAERVRNGLTIVLRGTPNVGKSSLLNALAGREVAIVAPTPGTTRDLVHIDLSVGGVAVRITDTAGIRPTDDVAELAGLKLGALSAERADLILTLAELDDCTADDLVITKIDLSGKPPGVRGSRIYISAKTGAGIEQLLLWIEQWVASKTHAHSSSIITSARQHGLLNQCCEYLRAALCNGDRLLQAEITKTALRLLDRIVHEDHRDILIDRVFSRLCIGK